MHVPYISLKQCTYKLFRNQKSLIQLTNVADFEDLMDK